LIFLDLKFTHALHSVNFFYFSIGLQQPEPQRMKNRVVQCYSPQFYTDFNISETDSVMLTGTDCYYAESLPPYFVKIAHKEFLSHEAIWLFTLVDSLCSGQCYYYTLKDDSDSITYDCGTLTGEDMYLMND
jgi:hypothetical protein